MKAFITGASSGIGEALATLLASKGYTLILSGRNEESLQRISNAFKADYIVADLAKRADRDKLIEAIRREVPDLFVNCAGYGKYGEALSVPVSEHLKLLEVNAAAPIELTLEAAHSLIAANKKGVILNVSSVAGEYPTPGMGLYGSSKACLTHFSRTLNTELASRGVHVLVSCPGMVATPFATRAANKPITPSGPVMTAQFAAEQMWKQIETLQEKRVINWFYRIVTLTVPASIAKKVMWKRIKERL